MFVEFGFRLTARASDAFLFGKHVKDLSRKERNHRTFKQEH
jgi:hypothetical protein